MAKSISEMEYLAHVRATQENLFVEEHGEDSYLVSNLDNNTKYIVRTEDGHIKSCDCPHHIYRDVLCKHQVAVSNEMNIPI